MPIFSSIRICHRSLFIYQFNIYLFTKNNSLYTYILLYEVDKLILITINLY